MNSSIRNTKIYSLVAALPPEERSGFIRFAKSPYFNSSKELTKLFTILHTFVSKDKEPEKLKIWQKLKGKERYNDVRFRKYCSDLTKLIEKFLVQEQFENDEARQSLYLMQSIRKYEIDKLENSAIRRTEDIQTASALRNSDFYLNGYFFERSIYRLKRYDTNRSDKSNIETIGHNLDVFYTSARLKIYYDMVLRDWFVKQNYDYSELQNLLDYCSSAALQSVPLIAVLRQLVLMVWETENVEHYDKAKSLLLQYEDIFSQRELLDIYYTLISYCQQKLLKDTKFTEEFFNLYKKLIDTGILFQDDQLSPWDFNNIMSVSLRLGKYEWAERFIHDYSFKLPEDVRRNAVTYNLGVLYYYQKKYDDVIQQLSHVEYEEISYNLNSRVLLIATYYEIDEYDPLFSLFDSFGTYLNRHKEIPTNKRKYFYNLIKFTKKLAKMRPGDRDALKKIKEELNQTEEVVSKNWLMDKIAELE